MGVQFHKGVPKNTEALFTAQDIPSMVILDDLMHESSGSEQVTKLLTKLTHHLGLFAVSLAQNLFQSGKEKRLANATQHRLNLLFTKLPWEAFRLH